jgi:hypothetical protein
MSLPDTIDDLPVTSAGCEGCPLLAVCERKSKWDRALLDLHVALGVFTVSTDPAIDSYVENVLEAEARDPALAENPLRAALNASLRQRHATDVYLRESKRQQWVEELRHREQMIKPWDDLAALAIATCQGGPVVQRPFRMSSERGEITRCSSSVISYRAQNVVAYTGYLSRINRIVSRGQHRQQRQLRRAA